MTTRRAPIEPRLFSDEQAARYCGVSTPTFKKICPIQPIRFSNVNRVLYDKARLDRWIDSLPGNEPKLASKDWGELLDGAHAP